jgi:aryl-phospho-beta-D-glucosidase BglC (GH1 family)
MTGSNEITPVASMIHSTRSQTKLKWCFALALLVSVLITGWGHAAAASPMAAGHIVTLPCPYSIANMALHTQGNKLLNSQNELTVLHGVDLPSLEWTNRGDHIRRSMRAAITQWHCRIIRIPTSVNRWFGQAPGQSHGGRVYRHIVDQLIRIAARHHVYVVLDLHWNDMNRTVADIGQHRMPDHTCVLYWLSAARRYMDYPNVLFDLYNEPHGISWITWRDGGICTGETKTTVVTYRAVGMQRLYDVVRHAGAANVVIIGGISWAYDDFGVTHGYAINGKNIVYDCHVYPWKPHWKHSFELAAKRVPLIIDEFGGSGNQLAFGRKVIAYAAAHHISWCSWSFHTQAGPVLIKNWNYQPSKFGALIKKALILTKDH